MTTRSAKHDDILGQVQTRAELKSRQAAVTAIRAVLTTLGERLGLELGHQLGRQLPREIGMFLEASDATEQFDARELVRRVGEREGLGRTEAARHARVVLSVVAESISVAALASLRDALTPDYEPLFDARGAVASDAHLEGRSA